MILILIIDFNEYKHFFLSHADYTGLVKKCEVSEEHLIHVCDWCCCCIPKSWRNKIKCHQQKVGISLYSDLAHWQFELKY